MIVGSACVVLLAGSSKLKSIDMAVVVSAYYVCQFHMDDSNIWASFAACMVISLNSFQPAQNQSSLHKLTCVVVLFIGCLKAH